MIVIALPALLPTSLLIVTEGFFTEFKDGYKIRQGGEQTEISRNSIVLIDSDGDGDFDRKFGRYGGGRMPPIRKELTITKEDQLIARRFLPQLY